METQDLLTYPPSLPQTGTGPKYEQSKNIHFTSYNTLHLSLHLQFSIPQMMRVHPVLPWQYADVWTFIQGLSIPYPVLYDQVAKA